MSSNIVFERSEFGGNASFSEPFPYNLFVEKPLDGDSMPSNLDISNEYFTPFTRLFLFQGNRARAHGKIS